jgi:agmatine/peptidylarginine deiminase
MSTEFIIGTIIGLIGISPLIYKGVVKLKQQKNLPYLMNELVSGKHTQAEQQKILQKISNGLRIQFGEKLSKEYINEFSLGKKGKYIVFEEMCIKNKIEPQMKLCVALLANDYPSFREKYYQSLKQSEPNINPTEESVEEIKIIENQNKTLEKRHQVVYLSELLKENHFDTYNKLIAILDKHNVPHKLLKATKDIWCKDYMPVQTTSGKLVQFRYEPSYLKENEEYENSRSDVKEVCKANNIQPIFSEINLDGGNVLICSDRAIISDRVFTENPDTDKEDLISKLKEELEVKEIIIIPAQKEDFTGHADGMVRFVNRDTILGNDRNEEIKKWTEKMNKVQQKHELKYLDIPFFWDYKDRKHPNHAIGIYVNYLEVNDLIVIPIFEVSGNKDAETVERFKQIFPDRKIETINYNEIGLEGGLLNCTTWTIFEKVEE